ncbi:MAG TPA: glycosyltransferase [Longimicrobiales bacterium]
MRVALVHDWLTGMRGGERVLEELIGLWPDAEIFTLLHVPGSVSPVIESRPIHASFIGRLPGVARRYRSLLPLFPAAIERFDLRGFDLVVSSSHCVAKGVRPPGAPHVCYCHTPMRYVWDLYDDYFGPGRAALPVRLLMPAVAAWLRRWDRRTAARVDTFIANSAHVRERIRRCYGRDAIVVHPPVDVERFRPAATREDFYLIVSALVPYKRVDLAIEAFNRLGRPLVIAGTGPELGRLRRIARPNIRFAGWLPDEEIADLYARCRAFIFPGIEDFGITAVEAQAAGAPVIAYGAGGALETVIGWDGRRADATGVFFDEATPEALAAAVERADRAPFDPAALRASAERFSPHAFRQGMLDVVERLVSVDGDGAARVAAEGQAGP